MRANPGGLLSPDEVVGRDELIARLWRILERQSLILTSERRMGKTSIIRKMAAASPSGQLAIYRDLEPLSTPLEFVQIVVDDVRRYLNRSQRTVRRVLEFLEQFGGTEVSGVIKLPDTVATNWQTLLMRTIEDLVEHQDRTLIFLWDEMPMMLDKIKQSNGENEAMEVLNTLRYLR
ncbi:MAG: ATP-binding protein, partial [Candidatus Tectomicrobia bacterium]|nr:ATP-binding protein [Candidatus Tectomicrobia bacterium]